MKLENLTVKELQKEASKYPEITGVHSMKKAEIVEAITKASEQPQKEEKKEEIVEVIAKPPQQPKKKEKKADKGALKKKLRVLKTQRKDALENRDAKALKSIRTTMKRLKRKTRKFTAPVSESS